MPRDPPDRSAKLPLRADRRFQARAVTGAPSQSTRAARGNAHTLTGDLPLCESNTPGRADSARGARAPRRRSLEAVNCMNMHLVGLDAILSPEGASSAKQHQLAPRRFSTLDGVRLGLLGNSKLNADAVLLAVADLLRERYKVESV